MALFKKSSKNQTQVPAEIQEYYQAEKRDRTGIAWLLAFATLVVTILLAAGIFFAGRFVYRKIAGSDSNDSSSQVAQNEDDQKEEQTNSSSSQQSEEEKQRQDEASKKAEEQKVKEEQAQKERQEAERNKSEQSVAPTLPSDENSGSNQRATTENDNIPNTGPGDTLAIFFAVSILGYLGHRLFAAKKA